MGGGGGGEEEEGEPFLREALKCLDYIFIFRASILFHHRKTLDQISVNPSRNENLFLIKSEFSFKVNPTPPPKATQTLSTVIG